VRAVSDFVDGVDPDRLEPLQLHAGVRHHVFELFGVRPPVVEQHADLDALPGLRREGLRELRGNLPLVEDEQLDVHAGPGVADRVEHVGEEDRPVLEQDRLVVGNELVAEDLERPAKLRAVDAVVRFVGVGGALVPEEMRTPARRQHDEQKCGGAQRRASGSKELFHAIYLSVVPRVQADALPSAGIMPTSR